MSDGLVLGFDTSAAHCAAALLSGNEILCETCEEMGRGQAERLFPLLEDLLASAGADWSDLARIGVGTGPGNFTGIRISVSAARGLALALDIPAVGVSLFEVIAAEMAGTRHLPAVPAPRDQLYIKPTSEAPRLVQDAEARAMDLPLTWPPAPTHLAGVIARLAARADRPLSPPAPLYIRPADAALPREAPPAILDDDT